MNKIIHKFYIVGLILIFSFGLGYAQLAFFLHNESKSTLKAKDIQVVQNDIQQLRRLFVEIRFWEKIIFFETTPTAERQFGSLLRTVDKQLADLKRNTITSAIQDKLNFISHKLTEYKTTFDQIVQLETEQRLGQTLLDNTYQTLTANILRSKELGLLRPIFNLAHFQQNYQESHRLSEYKALKIVIRALERKLHQQQISDQRLAEYCTRYEKLLDHDFLREKKIQLLNDGFDQITAEASQYLQAAIKITNTLVEHETKIANQLRRRLNFSFLVSMSLMILGVFLIATYIFRQIINPIQALSEVSRNIREGKMSARFAPLRKTTDELTELGASFNIMLDTLAMRENELASHSDSLEDLVASRTSKLYDANMALSKEVASRKEIERKLQQYTDTQTVLLQEVNHRVKNNLVAIIGMLHQEEDRASAEPAEDASGSVLHIQELTKRISGLLTVHSLLSSSQWKPLSLAELSQSIIQGVFEGVPVGKTIDFEVSPTDVHIDSDQAHYLAIVLNELAINSMKYALSDRDSAKTQISIHLQDNSIYLEYHDDGPGYPESLLYGESPKNSIGFQLILGIVTKSLRGRIELLNDNGAMARIIFPAMTS